jgi:PPP family 3-phenylpropionic acid transporter
MVTSLASVVIQPLWGILCDRTGKIKTIFLSSILASIPVTFGLLLGKKSTVLMGIVVFILSSSFLSMGAVLDSWIVKMINQGQNVQYSLTRGIGSLAYAVMAIGFGRYLDVAGMEVIPLSFAVMALVMVTVAFFIRAPERESHHGQAGNPFAGMGILVRNRRFLLLMVSIMLLYAGNGATMVFMPVRMESLGGTNATLGIAMTLMALCEAPAMMLHQRIARHIRNETLLAVAMFFFILKGVATALAPSTAILILVQVLQFFSFGLYLPSIVQHINRMVDEKSLVTALLLFSSATYGLGMMVGGLVGGFLADAVGVQAMMLLLSIVTASGFVMFMLTGRKVERISPG